MLTGKKCDKISPNGLISEFLQNSVCAESAHRYKDIISSTNEIEKER